MKQTSPAPHLPTIDVTGMTFAIVAARFNAEISNALLAGAKMGFRDAGVKESACTVVHVPGAFEIPFAAKTLAATGKYSAIVCLGAVIRGETPHFDFVAGECARGVQDVALETGVPLLFGVLTTDDLPQAEARCAPDRSNKGWECAIGAVEMAAFVRSTHSK